MSNRGRGTGWKSFRPAGVMAGFLVLVKRGRILAFKMVSMTDQKDASGVERVAVLNLCSSSAEVARDSSVVHGSASEVKLVNARMMSGTSAALWTGTRESNDSITDIDSDDLSLSSRMRASFFPVISQHI